MKTHFKEKVLEEVRPFESVQKWIQENTEGDTESGIKKKCLANQ